MLTKHSTSLNIRSVPLGNTEPAVIPAYEAALQVKFGSSILQRFWAKVERSPDGCWLWTGALISKGYGQLAGARRPTKAGRMVPRPIYAHRISWELHRGSIPEGRWVLHHCDVPRCVNPEHLFLGDQKANMEDASAKGRLAVPRCRTRGFKDELIARYLAGGVTQVALAAEYGVSHITVNRWLKGLKEPHSKRGPRKAAA